MERCPECESNEVVTDYYNPQLQWCKCGWQSPACYTHDCNGNLIDPWQAKADAIERECKANQREWSLPWVAINMGPNASQGVLLRRC